MMILEDYWTINENWEISDWFLEWQRLANHYQYPRTD